MTIDVFLSRLRNVKQTRRGKCIASSPTREDKHLLLAIRERQDGRILIRDSGGSFTQEILDAVGLIFSDLFSPRKKSIMASPSVAHSRWPTRDSVHKD